MPVLPLFDDGTHKNILLEDLDTGLAVQANQHLIIHNNEGLILDPGGHKVYNRVLSATLSELRGGKLRYLFLSHQDPDVVAASNGWLMTTDAEAYCSALWIRFIPHFGLDRLVESRLKPIPDEDMTIDLNGAKLLVLPAHFLHSPGNFQIFDTASKILYSGDLGASVGISYREVTHFEDHLQHMEPFHKRYMAGNHALRNWVKMIRQLNIEIIAPQHGALFRGKPMVEKFIAWCEQLKCGIDLIPEYRIPAA
jgi:flavorubredoxin